MHAVEFPGGKTTRCSVGVHVGGGWTRNTYERGGGAGRAGAGAGAASDRLRRTHCCVVDLGRQSRATAYHHIQLLERAVVRSIIIAGSFVPAGRGGRPERELLLHT